LGGGGATAAFPSWRRRLETVGWWLNFELDELLLVAVAPFLLCCGVPGLLAVLAGHAPRRRCPQSWAEGKCSPLRQLPLIWAIGFTPCINILSSHLRWRSSPAVYVSLDGWCCGQRWCSWVAAWRGDDA
jgi:hypothetical protein